MTNLCAGYFEAAIFTFENSFKFTISYFVLVLVLVWHIEIFVLGLLEVRYSIRMSKLIREHFSSCKGWS
jgi:hypothetical protein